MNGPFPRKKPSPVGAFLDRGHPMAKSIAAYWLLGEQGGKTAYDLTNKGSNGTMSTGSGSRVVRAGRFDAGVRSFPGVGSDIYFDCGTGAATTNLDHSGMTLATWVRDEGDSAFSYDLLGRNDGNTVNAGWCVGWRVVQGGLGFISERGTANCQAFQTGWTFGVWKHLAVTYTGGTTAASDIKIYYNGISQSLSSTQNGSGTQGSDAAQTMFLGKSPFTSAVRNFKGLLENVVLWARVLSATEIYEHYQNPFGMLVQPPDRKLRLKQVAAVADGGTGDYGWLRSFRHETRAR